MSLVWNQIQLLSLHLFEVGMGWGEHLAILERLFSSHCELSSFYKAFFFSYQVGCISFELLKLIENQKDSRNGEGGSGFKHQYSWMHSIRVWCFSIN